MKDTSIARNRDLRIFPGGRLVDAVYDEGITRYNLHFVADAAMVVDEAAAQPLSATVGTSSESRVIPAL